MRLPRPDRRSRALAALAAGAAGLVAFGTIVIPVTAAQAETREGEVTVSIPSKIVIDGGTIPVTVTSAALYSSLDHVYVNLYQGDSMQGAREVQPNTSASISTSLLTAGSIIGRADLATTDCNVSSDDPCHFDSDGDYYEFVDGLTYLDSAAAIAKYGSKVSLIGIRDGKKVTWTATAQRYGESGWAPWKGVAVTIGAAHVTTSGKGVATWVEKTKMQHAFSAKVGEAATVWGSVSTTATPKKAAKPPKVTASSSAATVGRAMQFKVASIRKVQKLTAKTDPNGLLGRPNGYSSAAVLYDSRTSCSDGPGADCGATIERWPTTAKATARSKYILGLLDSATFLGSEYHAVKGRFLIRVTGDLTPSQAKAYKKAFRAVL